jgi:hypothetical protein
VGIVIMYHPLFMTFTHHSHRLFFLLPVSAGVGVTEDRCEADPLDEDALTNPGRGRLTGGGRGGGATTTDCTGHASSKCNPSDGVNRVENRFRRFLGWVSEVLEVGSTSPLLDKDKSVEGWEDGVSPSLVQVELLSVSWCHEGAVICFPRPIPLPSM